MQGQTVRKAEKEMTALLSTSWAVRKLIQDAGGLAWIHCSAEKRVTHILGMYFCQIAAYWKKNPSPLPLLAYYSSLMDAVFDSLLFEAAYF